MGLRYHPDAEIEVVEAAQFYEERVAGLGDQFLSELDAAISRIEEASYRSPLIENDVRRFVIQRFAYSIYYRVEGEDIRILVVKHHSRHPDYWRYRLRR